MELNTWSEHGWIYTKYPDGQTKITLLHHRSFARARPPATAIACFHFIFIQRALFRDTIESCVFVSLTHNSRHAYEWYYRSHCIQMPIYRMLTHHKSEKESESQRVRECARIYSNEWLLFARILRKTTQHKYKQTSQCEGTKK